MTEVKVPNLAESITEGTISNWVVKEGDYVKQGDILLELETDKVNMEISAEQAGVVKKIIKQAGENVEVGEVIAHLDENASTEATSESKTSESSEAKTPAPQTKEETKSTQSISDKQDSNKKRTNASPAMRKLAREKGVDVDELQAELYKKDDGNDQKSTQQISEPTSPAQEEVNTKPIERKRMTRRQQTIATNLVQSQHNAAMLTTFNEVDMTKVMDIRKRRKQAFIEKHDINLGFMSFFSKAVVGALKAFPILNSEIDGQDILYKKYYDIGIAVANDAGLVVPVVRNVDSLTFVEIERQIASLANKARTNKLTLDELKGGTFTITNGGVFGSLFSTPILNAPQVGILGMHTIQKRPVTITTADGDKLEHRPMMYIALSYDHRIVDGREAVGFLATVKKLIEDPELLLLEG
ncbi:2-oxoglutarate dehydrogenase complex dihydrolipoyllysine-residue succinyltransferase [Shimazuella sp. AN120528]|uniref:2-oxoglutarate dehydrogenase complex dihydrolipoyllysine-residue succinyltransferase n=1 Tax=Shimazuella soli TaxID=1892854 RepID=UPI001F0F8E83|nr:2-oxoglutarate dehydrogenase complex dihydrolipoyllysine-residue succinyltransferase [Shimazuella soli]MCH5586644.1 2-oxoglutarate dehydrogenase complex dihydrolipoyllysine-residue succinyltransferase [Shimazuella soli]